jgi:hypothetical protein
MAAIAKRQSLTSAKLWSALARSSIHLPLAQKPE